MSVNLVYSGKSTKDVVQELGIRTAQGYLYLTIIMNL